jgi:murein DD-endopeptidase MepM/ murein hydrolase activator NlpD
MRRLNLTLVPILLALLLPFAIVQAQTEEPTPEPTTETGPDEPAIPRVHAVQEGESLTIIAEIYAVSVVELQVLNNLADDAILSIGQELLVPGGEGEAIATVYTVQVGDTLGSVAAAFSNTEANLLEINHLINTYYEPVAGQALTAVSRTGSALPQPITGSPHLVGQGEGLLALAARYNILPARLAVANGLSFPTYLYPGQRLRIPSEELYRDLPGEWAEIQVRPWPIVQGSTVSVYVESLLEGQPSGNFAGQTLRFVPHTNGFVALAGLDAFTDPGTVALILGGTGNRPWRPFRQELQIGSADYGIQRITIPPELSHLLAPEVRQNEDAFLESIFTRFSVEQLWEGLFQTPVTNTIITAGYGDARSYNEGPVEVFHTGVDFGGVVGTLVLASADGVVVFNDVLQLRGRTVIVDHGLGVMTAYFHLSESFVENGMPVATGQAIAAGGSTGLSTGPHLHWDLRVMNVPVDGLRWTRERFP